MSERGHSLQIVAHRKSLHVRFSNRPFEVKRFQTIHRLRCRCHSRARAFFGTAAELLNLELVVFTVRNSGEIARALNGIAAADVGVVNVLASPMLNGARRLIVERLRDARLPSIYEWPEIAADGGLIGSGAPIASLYRRVAVFVDKILRGANPADLPIEQPTKFELVVNLRTAHEIGIALSPSLLLRADQVIE
jgi:putative tryptophan/tyrosine transport system substrate-binding protein